MSDGLLLKAAVSTFLLCAYLFKVDRRNKQYIGITIHERHQE